MCADFVAPTFQYPDFLRSAALGQQAGQQAAMFPYQLQGAQQQVQQGQLNLDMLRQAMGLRQQAFQSYQDSMAGLSQPSGTQSTQTGQQPGGPAGGIETGPQASVTGPPGPPSASQPYNPYDPGPLAPFLDTRRVAANAAYGQFNAMLSGKDPNEPIAAGLKLQEDARADAINRAKFQAEMPNSPLSVLKGFAINPQAASALWKNPQMLPAYAQLANKWGADPMDPRSVARVAAMEYNQRGAPLGLSVDVPPLLRAVQRGNGDTVYIDEMTGKPVANTPAVATDKYIVNGKVVELPKAQGVAQGLQPYDGPLLAADILKGDAPIARTPALEQAYQQFKATGTPPPVAGRDAIAIASETKYIADRSKEDGLTGQTAAAQQQNYAAQGKVLNDYTDPSGKAGGKLQNINTVTEHAQALYPLIDAMKNGPSPALNAARVAYERQTGQPAPTSYQAMANIFTGELNTAINQGDSGDKEGRERILAPFANVNGPDVLKDAIRVSATAMAGKTHGLEQGWNAAGMQETHGPFNQFLSPATKQFLDGGKVPDVGTISKGYRFLGGDPSKPASWVKAGG